jgi:hypothetical protein
MGFRHVGCKAAPSDPRYSCASQAVNVMDCPRRFVKMHIFGRSERPGKNLHFSLSDNAGAADPNHPILATQSV